MGGAKAIRADIGFSERSGYIKRCAGTPLTFLAMTGADEDRIGNRFSLERSTATARDSGHFLHLAERHRHDRSDAGGPSTPTTPEIPRSGWSV
jgi:hypothetical protein